MEATARPPARAGVEKPVLLLDTEGDEPATWATHVRPLVLDVAHIAERGGDGDGIVGDDLGAVGGDGEDEEIVLGPVLRDGLERCAGVGVRTGLVAGPLGYEEREGLSQGADTAVDAWRRRPWLIREGRESDTTIAEELVGDGIEGVGAAGNLAADEVARALAVSRGMTAAADALAVERTGVQRTGVDALDGPVERVEAVLVGGGPFEHADERGPARPVQRWPHRATLAVGRGGRRDDGTQQHDGDSER